jgi:two-component system response regulator LytT
MKHAQETGKETLRVSQGNSQVVLAASRIAYGYHDGGHNFVRSIDREDYLLSESLQEIEDALDARQFFRVSRKLIVNIAACRRVNLNDDGRLEVLLEPFFKEPVLLRQQKATAFKKWLAAGRK